MTQILTFEHKGFSGQATYVPGDGEYFGRIDGGAGVVTFRATNLEDLESAFIDSVEDYLEFCQELGKQP